MDDRLSESILDLCTLLDPEHRRIVEDVLQRDPDARGPLLGWAVLRQIAPDIANGVQDDKAMHFSPRWQKNNTHNIPNRGEKMTVNDIIWVIAALVVGGTILAAITNRLSPRPQNRTDTSPTQEIHKRTVTPPTPSYSRIALAAFSGKIQDIGVATASAGELLTLATCWWSGSSNQWNDLAQAVGFTKMKDLPDHDDELIVVAFEAPDPVEGAPTSRPEWAARLREAARTNELRLVGTYRISSSASLDRAGFRY